MQLTLERARQIAVTARLLDGQRPTDRAELGALAAWLRLDRVEVTRVSRL